MLAVSDSLLLSSKADATLLIHRPGSVDKKALKRVRLSLEQARAKVLGVVLNRVTRSQRHLYPTYLESPYIRQDQGQGACVASWRGRRAGRS